MTDYTVADYLLDRLAQVGVDRIFGVPGDYTLAMLDHIVEHREIAWTGCANELNAGYAADGYARMRGLGAFTTTFGVGELSAINAVAGSFAEHVPVIEIVGSPASGTQAAQRIVHHSLGDGQFDHFLEIHNKITCARAALTAANAAAEIDRVIAAVRDQRLPGYLLIPADVALAPISRPETELPPPTTVSDPAVRSAFAEAAARLIRTAPTAADVSVLGGLLVHRYAAVDILTKLLGTGPFAHATTLWGKSLVDESDPNFLGVYTGSASTEAVRSGIEDAAVIITAGVQFTDLNSGFFSQNLDRGKTIEIDAAAASVGEVTFAPLGLWDALDTLIPLLAEVSPAGHPARQAQPEPSRADNNDESLTQAQLWSSVASFLAPGDIVLADQGTSFYGMATHRLPRDVTFLGQPLWASIGYTLPALLGACLAEPSRRGILLIGDGAAQLTVQELGTMLRAGISPLIVVVDNDGYTVERAIHGPTEPYNDIPHWDWRQAGSFFGPEHRSQAFRVETGAELIVALAQVVARPDVLTIIQAVVAPLDVPDLLTAIARSAAAANDRAMTAV